MIKQKKNHLKTIESPCIKTFRTHHCLTHDSSDESTQYEYTDRKKNSIYRLWIYLQIFLLFFIFNKQEIFISKLRNTEIFFNSIVSNNITIDMFLLDR